MDINCITPDLKPYNKIFFIFPRTSIAAITKNVIVRQTAGDIRCKQKQIIATANSAAHIRYVLLRYTFCSSASRDLFLSSTGARHRITILDPTIMILQMKTVKCTYFIAKTTANIKIIEKT